MSEPEPLKSSPIQTSSSLADQLTRAAAILGAFFAVGQTGSQTVQSFFQHRNEQIKAQQDLILSRQKSDNDLAATFLNKILEKDVTDENRRILFGALTTLKTHPLQKWAEEQHEKAEQTLTRIERADQRQIDLVLTKSTADQTTGLLESKIEILSLKIQLSHDNPEAVERLHQEQLIAAQQLSKAKADQARSTAGLQSLENASTAEPPETTPNAPTGPLKDKLRSILAARDKNDLFDKYIDYIYNALAEKNIGDRKMIAAVLALTASATDYYRSVTEYGSGTYYELRADLGNVKPGDGEAYKGRGLTQITGRSNYTNTSERLGLGTLLVDSPDDLNKPAIAARALLLFVVDNKPKLSAALASDDLISFYRVFNGGTNGAQGFVTTYRETLQVLNGR